MLKQRRPRVIDGCTSPVAIFPQMPGALLLLFLPLSLPLPGAVGKRSIVNHLAVSNGLNTAVGVLCGTLSFALPLAIDAGEVESKAPLPLRTARLIPPDIQRWNTEPVTLGVTFPVTGIDLDSNCNVETVETG